MIAFIPGSFDPVTFGHLDIIYRATELYDKVVIAVLVNESKVGMFTLKERVELIKKSIEIMKINDANIEIVMFEGLLVSFIQTYEGKKIIVKGLRTVTDYEYELQMAHLNRDLGIETSLMVTLPEYSYISSSMVKSVAKLGGDVGTYVPHNVARAVYEFMDRENEKNRS